MTAADGTIKVMAAGDVYPTLPEPYGSASFDSLRPLLASADIVFGNCEGVYSDDPHLSPTRKFGFVSPTSRGHALNNVQFDVMTCANNHILDGGYSGLRDTLALLDGCGIAAVGAGGNIESAAAPFVIERSGIRVSFLGFCSVFPKGYEARHDRPGLASLRVRTHYSEPDPNFWEPGIPSLVSTEVIEADYQRLQASVRRARETSDVVIIGFHWGYSSLIKELMRYEVELARDAVALGADAVVCHHHHSLRGVEVFDKRPIYYGLGALVHHFKPGLIDRETAIARRSKLGPLSAWEGDPDFPYFPFRKEARMTGVAQMSVRGDGVVSAGLVPAEIRSDGTTSLLRLDNPGVDRILEYLVNVNDYNGIDAEVWIEDAGPWPVLRFL